MESERTLILVKPDGVQRGLIGTVISRIELSGLKISGMKLIQMDDDLAARHYEEHREKPFYAGLVSFIASGPVVAMCVEGQNAVASMRRLMGATNPQDAAPGTLRGDHCVDIGRNLVHGSATPEDAEREVAIFFQESEILQYERAHESWISEGA